MLAHWAYWLQNSTLSQLYSFLTQKGGEEKNSPKTPNPGNKAKNHHGRNKGRICLVNSHIWVVLQASSWGKVFWWIVFLVGHQSNWVLFPPEALSKLKIEDFDNSRNLEQGEMTSSTHQCFVLHAVDSLSLCNTMFWVALLMQVVVSEIWNRNTLFFPLTLEGKKSNTKISIPDEHASLTS